MRVLGADHPDTLTSRNNLACAYQAAGDLGRAIPLLEQALADGVRVLGADHPDTLASRNNLAGAYQAAGDLGRAIPLYEQTLADRRAGAGRRPPRHPDLAEQPRLRLPGRRGTWAGPSRCTSRPWPTACGCWAPTTPSTLASRNNLAAAYQAAGDLGRAIPLFEQALADCVRVLGADHPQTKTVRANLAAARQHPQ